MMGLPRSLLSKKISSRQPQRILFTKSGLESNMIGDSTAGLNIIAFTKWISDVGFLYILIQEAQTMNSFIEMLQHT